MKGNPLVRGVLQFVVRVYRLGIDSLRFSIEAPVKLARRFSQFRERLRSSVFPFLEKLFSPIFIRGLFRRLEVVIFVAGRAYSRAFPRTARGIAFGKWRASVGARIRSYLPLELRGKLKIAEVEHVTPLALALPHLAAKKSSTLSDYPSKMRPVRVKPVLEKLDAEQYSSILDAVEDYKEAVLIQASRYPAGVSLKENFRRYILNLSKTLSTQDFGPLDPWSFKVLSVFKFQPKQRLKAWLVNFYKSNVIVLTVRWLFSIPFRLVRSLFLKPLFWGLYGAWRSILAAIAWLFMFAGLEKQFYYLWKSSSWAVGMVYVLSHLPWLTFKFVRFYVRKAVRYMYKVFFLTILLYILLFQLWLPFTLVFLLLFVAPFRKGYAYGFFCLFSIYRDFIWARNFYAMVEAASLPSELMDPRRYKRKPDPSIHQYERFLTYVLLWPFRLVGSVVQAVFVWFYRFISLIRLSDESRRLVFWHRAFLDWERFLAWPARDLKYTRPYARNDDVGIVGASSPFKVYSHAFYLLLRVINAYLASKYLEYRVPASMRAYLRRRPQISFKLGSGLLLLLTAYVRGFAQFMLAATAVIKGLPVVLFELLFSLLNVVLLALKVVWVAALSVVVLPAVFIARKMYVLTINLNRQASFLTATLYFVLKHVFALFAVLCFIVLFGVDITYYLYYTTGYLEPVLFTVICYIIFPLFVASFISNTAAEIWRESKIYIFLFTYLGYIEFHRCLFSIMENIMDEIYWIPYASAYYATFGVKPQFYSIIYMIFVRPLFPFPWEHSIHGGFNSHNIYSMADYTPMSVDLVDFVIGFF